jgi:predicted RNase H-like nuclease (RuvC/YqgF family)
MQDEKYFSRFNGYAVKDAKARDDIAKLDSDLKGTINSIGKNKSDIDTSKEDIKTLNANLNKSNESIEANKANINALQTSFNSVKTDNDTNKEKIDSLEEALNNIGEVGASVGELTQSINKNVSDIETLNTNLAQTNANVALNTQGISDVNARVDNIHTHSTTSIVVEENFIWVDKFDKLCVLTILGGNAITLKNGVSTQIATIPEGYRPKRSIGDHLSLKDSNWNIVNKSGLIITTAGEIKVEQHTGSDVYTAQMIATISYFTE